MVYKNGAHTSGKTLKIHYNWSICKGRVCDRA